MSKNLEADIFLTYQKNFSGTCVYTQCGDSTDPTILLGWCWEDHLSGWVGGLRHSDSGSFGHWTPPRWIFRFLQLKNLIARSHLLLTEDPFVLLLRSKIHSSLTRDCSPFYFGNFVDPVNVCYILKNLMIPERTVTNWIQRKSVPKKYVNRILNPKKCV